MTTPIRKAGSLALLLLASSPLHALDFDVGEFGISFVNRFTIGAAWRIEERDPDLIGKLNLDPDLCAGDDCLSFTGDPEPIMRLVEAPGAFFGDKVDDGNLNYDQYDMVAGLAKVTSDLSINCRDFNLKARGIAFWAQPASCASDELALLPPVPSWLLTVLPIWNAYPLLDGDDSSGLICYG